MRTADEAEQWRVSDGDERGWFLSHRGRVLALGGRWFASARDRDRSLESVGRMLRTAALGDAPVGSARPNAAAVSLRSPRFAHHESDGQPPLIGTGIRTPIKEITRHRWTRR